VVMFPKIKIKRSCCYPRKLRKNLNRCLLEVSMEWLKAKNGDLDWKVKRDGFTITIEPAAKEKKEQ
jgi:hypothetical protein